MLINILIRENKSQIVPGKLTGYEEDPKNQPNCDGHIDLVIYISFIRVSYQGLQLICL